MSRREGVTGGARGGAVQGQVWGASWLLSCPAFPMFGGCVSF